MFLVDFFSSEGMDSNPDMYLFKWQHFVYLAVCVLLFFLLMKVINNRNKTVQKIIIISSCLLLLIFKYGGEAIFVWEWNHFGATISTASHPFWDVRTFISFQVCGINNVLLPLVIAFNIKPLKNFVFSASIIGGLAVMIYPVGVLFGDPIVITFPLLRTLFVHFLLVFLPCYLIKIDNFHFDRRYWYHCLLGSIGVLIWAMVGNLFITPGANNMFLMVNPFANGPIPIVNILPNGWHVIFLVMLCALGFLLVYLASNWYIHQRSRLKG
ncbi:MAG: hypothetical protein WC479_03460 [Candidatus Izemoplasmatales bacterium]|jgi:hypothetical protein|nr:YwaF family protein [Candidatus Izemoplasmatales bacterium]MDD3864801.1 YwaF family protein [Candidatus Izemoplasmatales bacterium]